MMMLFVGAAGSPEVEEIRSAAALFDLSAGLAFLLLLVLLSSLLFEIKFFFVIFGEGI